MAPASESEASGSPGRDLPAGVDSADLDAAPPASARRGKLRRRLRYLRRVRELLLRDLGGFSYELHRTAGGIARESHRRLADAKARRLAALDAEVRDLESRLNEPHVEPLLREPGIGGTCPECGELHASDAHYCSRCGAPLDKKAQAEREAAIRAAAQLPTGSQPASAPKPASVLWAAGPRPQRAASDDEAPQQASPATSEWLAARKPATPASAEADAASATAEEAPAAAADEPSAAAPDETAADEPSAGGADESPAAADDAAAAATNEPAAAATNEPPAAATNEPAAADDAAAASAGDELAATDEPAAAPAEPTAADEPRAGGDAPPADKSAADEEPAEGSAGAFGPNGRRDDVVPPFAPGERLGSQGERRE